MRAVLDVPALRCRYCDVRLYWDGSRWVHLLPNQPGHSGTTMSLEKQIHQVLMGGDRSVHTLLLDFPGRSEASLRSALSRMYNKGWVDRYGWNPMLWAARRLPEEEQ